MVVRRNYSSGVRRWAHEGATYDHDRPWCGPARNLLSRESHDYRRPVGRPGGRMHSRALLPWCNIGVVAGGFDAGEVDGI